MIVMKLMYFVRLWACSGGRAMFEVKQTRRRRTHGVLETSRSECDRECSGMR